MIGWRKSSLLRQPITLPDFCFRFASREQIRLVENGPKSTGCDNLPPRLLKDSASNIASPLTHIINLSMQTGLFPSEWKSANYTNSQIGLEVEF